MINEYYTIERIVDELYLCLIKLDDYKKQAHDIIYQIPVHEPTPIFKVKIADLDKQVKKELDDRWTDKKIIDYILKEAVSRIFESIAERYFLLSVKKMLQVRLV